MITVKVTRKGNVFRATTEGHSELNPGNDIVCASVSALMYTLKGAVENLIEGGIKKYRIKSGIMDVKYIADSSRADYTATTIFNAIVIGMLQIQETYPEYVSVVPQK